MTNNLNITTKFKEIENTLDITIFQDNKEEKSKVKYVELYLFRRRQDITWNELSPLECVTILCNPKLTTLENEEEIQLSFLLRGLGVQNLSRISKFVRYYDKIKVGTDIITDCQYRGGTSRSCHVFARYVSEEFDFSRKKLHPGQIQKILDIIFESVVDNTTLKRSIHIAKVKWLETHDDEHYLGHSSPVKIYGELKRETYLIPIEFIEKRCIVIT